MAGASQDVCHQEQVESSRADALLTAIVSRPGTSVRLRNAICNADHQGSLPFPTVGEYMAAGSNAIPAMLEHVRSFGRKTALELDLLVREVWAGTVEPEQSPPMDVEISVEELTGALGAVTISEALAEEVTSVRLNHAVMRSGVGSEPLAAFLAHRTEFAARMLRQTNVGRTTVAELGNLALKVARRRLRAAGVPIAEAERLLVGHASNAGVDDVEEELPGAADLRGCAAWLLSKLRERDAEVLRLRFGLEGRPRETLEDVGRRYSITRERIRQIEGRALKTASTVGRRLPLDEALRLAWTLEWDRMTGGRGYLDDRSADQAIDAIDPDLALTMSVLAETPSSWLDRIAARRPHGWVGSPLSVNAVDAAASRMAENEHSPLPRPVDAGLEASEAVSAAAAAAVLGRATYRGYLIPRRGAARIRRAVDLHSLLIGIGGVLPVARLVGLHLVTEPSDPCSVRDALIVMEAAPHLFIEVCDDAWFAVGSSARARNPVDDAHAALTAPGDPGEGTIAHAIYVALAERGPERLHTLYKDAARILPPGRSPNSVGPVLISRPDLFERALPGVYGLTGELPDPLRLHEAPPPYLLEEQQLRLYALSRRCGEPMDIFPLWSASAEYALARWGRSSGRPESFRSLLAVADVARWPVSEDARRAWMEVASTERRFELSWDCRAGDYVLPEPERLLAAAILARHQSVLGWVAINRVCQKRLDASSAVGMLALMLRAGILVEGAEGGDWQSAHFPGQALDETIRSLSDELGRRGHLDWRSGAAGLVLATARNSQVTDWIDGDAFERMLDEASTRVPELERLMAEMLDHLLDPESETSDPFGEEPTRMSIERGDEMMNWLLHA